MITVCAWCGKTISKQGNDDRISHGCCKECEAKIRKETNIQRRADKDKSDMHYMF